MRNIQLTLQYDGSRYKGWQGQKDNDLTVQGKLQAVLEKMTEEPIELIGAERTDIGVHAENYIANFKTNCALSTAFMEDYMNDFLPDDIVIKEVEEVEERFHARYNVKSKTYRYTIDTNPYRNVFNRKYTYHMDEALDLKVMKEVAEILKGKHDFQGFTSMKAGTKSTRREVEDILIIQEGSLIKINIRANDFLWHMPRFMVGVLLEVGKGKMNRDAVKQLLNGNNKCEGALLAQSKALCLEHVMYEK